MRRLIVAVVLVAGAAACTPRGPAGGPNSSAPPPPGVGCPISPIGTAGSEPVLVPAPSNGLPTSPARGERLVIAGVVLDPACRPAEGASLNVWHTDSRGLYGPAGSNPDCCYYQGVVVTDGAGRFRLETIRPAQYPEPGAPPAHIHLELRHPSGRLTTEIIFTEDPSPVATARPEHAVPVHLGRRDGAFYGEVTFVLAKP